MTSETKKFIELHLNDDVPKLALKADKYKDVEFNLALNQIKGRQKIKHKVPFFYKNVDILYPQLLSIEQASSQITAIYKSNLFGGEILIDLTGGFGIDCYFLSKSYNQVFYVERNNELCDIAANNFKTLGANNILVNNTDSEEFIQNLKFADVIFIDPARRDSLGKKMVKLSDCEPNVTKLTEKLFEKTNKIMIKTSPLLDIKSALKELPATSEIHIISVDNECKELLFILDNQTEKNVILKTINFQKNHEQKFDFNLLDEYQSISKCTSVLYKYLYEPNSSIMKSGAFNTVASSYNLLKLHKNTHLYTSNELIRDFPGRIFVILSVSGSSKNDIKKLKSQYQKANITVRNYPVSVDNFRKKTAIQDGGDTFIFACKLENETNSIIVCTKINDCDEN